MLVLPDFSKVTYANWSILAFCKRAFGQRKTFGTTFGSSDVSSQSSAGCNFQTHKVGASNIPVLVDELHSRNCCRVRVAERWGFWQKIQIEGSQRHTQRRSRGQAHASQRCPRCACCSPCGRPAKVDFGTCVFFFFFFPSPTPSREWPRLLLLPRRPSHAVLVAEHCYSSISHNCASCIHR